MASSPFADYDVETCLERIRTRNERINAVLHVVEPRSSTEGPLRGVPYVLKDTWDTEGIVTTGGSWRHRARVPSTSSHAHRALANAGAVLLGKSNLSDLAFSTESDNHIRGPVRNPHDELRTGGGSTGGAAAIADGMAAFDWGSDFGGSIRGPAAWCGIAGLRLSTKVWPVGKEHFPRIAPFFWDMCGMGPLTRTVAGARFVTHALRDALRISEGSETAPSIDPHRVVIWAPDAAHEDEWPTFARDAQAALDRAGVGWTVDRGSALPTPSAVNALFTEYLAAHFEELMESGELSLREGIPAVLLAVLSAGKLDRRVHPNSGALFLALAALRFAYRDKARAKERVEDARSRVQAIWDAGALIVSPTTTIAPPRHGRALYATRSMSFCKLGNLVDATGLAVPFGRLATREALPRSLQILGPPGSEDAVLDLGERLEVRA